jgi:hypothetical protein
VLFEINSQIDMFSGKSDEPSQNKTNPKFHSRRHYDITQEGDVVIAVKLVYMAYICFYGVQAD